MAPDAPTPPVAPKRPHSLTFHGDERIDDWYWLREKDNPEVTAHLEAENAYTKAMLAHTEPLQEELFQEIKSRIQETDLTVPAKKDDWWYLVRTEEGQQYPIHCRRQDGPDGPEHVLLDENVEAGDEEFFALGVYDVTPDHRLLAYATDYDGNEVYTLRFRDLTTNADLDDVVEGVYYGSAWANDNVTFFYTRMDEAMRPYQLWRHRLGTPSADDVLVYQEDDEHIFLEVGRSKSDRYLFLELGSKVTSEVWFLDADTPEAAFTVIEPRRHNVEYAVEHQAGRFLIVTNDDGAEDFKIVSAPLDAPGKANWTEIVPHTPGVKIDGVEEFAEWVVVAERFEGLERLRVVKVDPASGAFGDSHHIEMPEPVYSVGGSANWEYDAHTLRFSYTSMVTPSSLFEYDLATRERTLLKQQPVLGDFDASRYRTERVWATASDGTRVPMSIMYLAGTEKNGENPCLLYGYGSYEASMDPTFSSIRLSLVDRGFVFAIAHVRGGGEMGRAWYEHGKMLEKKNTFTDFIACGEHLIAEGWTRADRMAARGGSAGGLLMGAVVNMRPDLWGAIVAQVPFVDALTTILDPSLPLTVTEWEEWGNPLEDADVYAYMKSYAPYDNVADLDYPAMLVTGGLNDPRVSYWEPAKWVQKLREVGKGTKPILLKTEMGAGHMGPSGRYDAWKDEAFTYAFILDALGR